MTSRCTRSALGTERDANAHLTRARRDGERHHAVDPDDRERERGDREQREEHGAEASLRGRGGRALASSSTCRTPVAAARRRAPRAELLRRSSAGVARRRTNTIDPGPRRLRVRSRKHPVPAAESGCWRTSPTMPITSAFSMPPMPSSMRLPMGSSAPKNVFTALSLRRMTLVRSGCDRVAAEHAAALQRDAHRRRTSSASPSRRRSGTSA